VTPAGAETPGRSGRRLGRATFSAIEPDRPRTASPRADPPNTRTSPDIPNVRGRLDKSASQTSVFYLASTGPAGACAHIVRPSLPNPGEILEFGAIARTPPANFAERGAETGLGAIVDFFFGQARDTGGQ